jgi:predicted nucleic acid-binding protein
MTIVVDASIVTQWYLQGDDAARADRMLQTDEWLIAPDLLIPEFTNSIWKAVAFSNFSTGAAFEAIADVESEIDEFVSSLELRDRAFAIAVELRHAAYDCFYLALAEQRDCPLVTADERLIRRCAGTSFGKLVEAL